MKCTVPMGTVFIISRRDRLRYTYLIVEATPPLRITSVCSVKTTNCESGYSRLSSVVDIMGSAGLGVRKNRRPAVAFT